MKRKLKNGLQCLEVPLIVQVLVLPSAQPLTQAIIQTVLQTSLQVQQTMPFFLLIMTQQNLKLVVFLIAFLA